MSTLSSLNDLWIAFTDKKPDIGAVVLLWGKGKPYIHAYIYSTGVLYSRDPIVRSMSEVMQEYSHWIELTPPLKGK